MGYRHYGTLFFQKFSLNQLTSSAHLAEILHSPSLPQEDEPKMLNFSNHEEESVSPGELRLNNPDNISNLKVSKLYNRSPGTLQMWQQGVLSSRPQMLLIPVVRT